MILPDQNVIAVMLDCDGTLCDDSTEALLLHEGINPRRFWRGVESLVRVGWDPSLAYMRNLILLNKEHKTKHRLTNEHLQKVGSQIRFYKGVPTFFKELKDFVARDFVVRKAKAILEFYVISSGFEEIIRGSKIAPYLDGFCGCTFDTDRKGEIAMPSASVTFTEKTKFVFAVNKGISFRELRRSPYLVNTASDPEDRRVPFENMIYAGDGPSDIPCLSTIMHFHGKGVGVYSRGSAVKGYQLAKGRRLTVGPYKADYTRGSDLRNMLEQMIREIALAIARRNEEKVVRPPSH